MGKKRASTAKQPPAKRTKPAPKPIDTQAESAEDGPSSAPLDLQQYIGTFDEINDYQQARRWCKYLGRKGRGGNLEALKEWLKDQYKRQGKGPLDKPNDLPAGFTPTGEEPSDRISDKPEAQLPGSRRGSAKTKTPQSSRLSSRGGKTPEHEPAAVPEIEEASESSDAAERITDAWRLIRTATNMLERDRTYWGVEDALQQLNGVLYESLADYAAIVITTSPAGYEAAMSAERRRELEAEEEWAEEANAADLKERYGRQPRAKNQEEYDENYTALDAVLARIGPNDDVEEVLKRVEEIEDREGWQGVQDWDDIIDLAFKELDQEAQDAQDAPSPYGEYVSEEEAPEALSPYEERDPTKEVESRRPRQERYQNSEDEEVIRDPRAHDGEGDAAVEDDGEDEFTPSLPPPRRVRARARPRRRRMSIYEEGN